MVLVIDLLLDFCEEFFFGFLLDETLLLCQLKEKHVLSSTMSK
jgi:hypothetical protein